MSQTPKAKDEPVITEASAYEIVVPQNEDPRLSIEEAYTNENYSKT